MMKPNDFRHVLTAAIFITAIFIIINGPTTTAPQAVLADQSTAQIPEFQISDPDDLLRNLNCAVPLDGKGLMACQLNMIEDLQPVQNLAALATSPCTDGFANGTYPCNNVDLQSFMPLADIGGGSGNDIWGWTDATTGKEYALMGRTNGVSFVDVSDPENPVYLGNLPTATVASIWRDLKVYQDHMFVVADSAGQHGMQVFDLTELRSVASPPVTFNAAANYSNIGSAHNIVINEDSGFAYLVGGSSGATLCSGGLHIVNIQNPTSPTFEACFSSDGYTHDAQCVNYTGPDADYQGQEICFNSNTDTLTIVDVTNKSNMIQIARAGYTGAAYTHQGWLTEDHRFFLLDDELDESSSNPNATTYIWDLLDLDSPQMIGTYTAVVGSIDHNLYIVGNKAYQANYQSGLRILDISDIGNANLNEIAYFDIYPASNNPDFNGAWSNYPFFASGTIIVSGMEQGLFVLKEGDGSSPTPTPTPSVTNTPTPGGDTVTVTAVADAFVSTRRPDANRGTLSQLRVDASPETNGYIKFNPQSVNGTVTNATLRIYAQTTVTTDVTVHEVTDNSWTETGITFNNAPALGASIASAPPTAETWTEFDVTSLVSGNGEITFGLSTASTNTIDFSAKEGANPPELIITFDDGGATATPVPTETPSPSETPLPPTSTPGSGSTMHVADLDGTSERNGRNWTAAVTITVVDENGTAVSDATVDAEWSAGLATATCFTDGNGQCEMANDQLSRQNSSVNLTVTNISLSSLAYEAANNTDPDGDSDGTLITINQP